ncbi:MAG TPA: hypothetical protein VJ673_09350 [Aromatoleum sp.]|uniref:hypothetical protein n=1 Tax=Aromatoleum sp. TaxID=2307007 RepID=UPI002B4889DA|nr:hypothetical protein [Aromatoleum sp.]HJV25883.1 hypothetical protein [Aromatoleum sp.]
MNEKGLKLAVGANSVVGFAGDVATARSLIAAYFVARETGSGARDGVRQALNSVCPCTEQSEVLFGFYEDNEPRLLHANTARNAISEVEGLVQLGSVPPSQREWTASYVSAFLDLLNRFGPHPLHAERIFTQLVALMQSYSVHDYLLPRGVGGAFVAAWVTPSGARWQGDHLYVIHDAVPNPADMIMCATMVRDDVLCLVNNQTGNTKLITWPHRSESEHALTTRVEAAGNKSLGTFDDAAFDYFISINKHKHVVTVLEMCGEQHTALVSLCAHGIDGKLGVVWTEELLRIVNTIAGIEAPEHLHMTLGFQPFIELNLEHQQEREQFAWESFVDQSI